MSKAYHALWLLCLGLSSCGSGEAVTQDFGEGYQGGSEPPPPTQRGQSTPTPNFSDCDECYDACYACIENAGDDENAYLVCLFGPDCEALLATETDSIPEYGVADDNILQTPGAPLPPEDCSQIEDYCLLCECYFGVGAEECVGTC